MRQEKSQKIKGAVHECIAAALDIDTTTIVEKTAEKEERAETIRRQEQQDERLQRQDITNGRTVLARKSKDFSQFGLPNEVRFEYYSGNTGNFIQEMYTLSTMHGGLCALYKYLILLSLMIYFK